MHLTPLVTHCYVPGCCYLQHYSRYLHCCCSPQLSRPGSSALPCPPSQANHFCVQIKSVLIRASKVFLARAHPTGTGTELSLPTLDRHRISNAARYYSLLQFFVYLLWYAFLTAETIKKHYNKRQRNIQRHKEISVGLQIAKFCCFNHTYIYAQIRTMNTVYLEK